MHLSIKDLFPGNPSAVSILLLPTYGCSYVYIAHLSEGLFFGEGPEGERSRILRIHKEIFFIHFVSVSIVGRQLILWASLFVRQQFAFRTMYRVFPEQQSRPAPMMVGSTFPHEIFLRSRETWIIRKCPKVAFVLKPFVDPKWKIPAIMVAIRWFGLHQARIQALTKNTPMKFFSTTPNLSYWKLM